MMDLTDRHARYFLRLISRHAVLYTEMITTGALLHGDATRFLAFDAAEHPLAIQLGGSQPREMAACARMAEAEGYDEININVGCPSDRVQSGRFGACLMADPGIVAECVAEMHAAVHVPVTVKTRIGIDRDETTERLYTLTEQIRNAGCRTLIVHARNAWLQGLSPKENREVPPLRYPVVYQLKRDFPNMEIVINGGITSVETCVEHLMQVDGVMLGREAYYNPWMLSRVDAEIYGARALPSLREDVVHALLPYIERELARGVSLAAMTRHIVPLFHGVHGARMWRRILSEKAHAKNAGLNVVLEALAALHSHCNEPARAVNF